MQYAGKPRDDATDPVHDGDLPEEGDTSVKLLRVEELSESDMEREEDIFSKIENDGNTYIIMCTLDLCVCKRWPGSRSLLTIAATVSENYLTCQ